MSKCTWQWFSNSSTICLAMMPNACELLQYLKSNIVCFIQCASANKQLSLSKVYYVCSWTCIFGWESRLLVKRMAHIYGCSLHVCIHACYIYRHLVKCTHTCVVLHVCMCVFMRTQVSRKSMQRRLPWYSSKYRDIHAYITFQLWSLHAQNNQGGFLCLFYVLYLCTFLTNKTMAPREGDTYHAAENKGEALTHKISETWTQIICQLCMSQYWLK